MRTPPLRRPIAGLLFAVHITGCHSWQLASSAVTVPMVYRRLLALCGLVSLLLVYSCNDGSSSCRPALRLTRGRSAEYRVPPRDDNRSDRGYHSHPGDGQAGVGRFHRRGVPPHQAQARIIRSLVTPKSPRPLFVAHDPICRKCMCALYLAPPRVA